MNIDLSGAVRALSGDVSVTVDRPNADTFTTGGFASAQTFTTSTVNDVSVQPIRGRDLIKAPEGVRPSEMITLYAPSFVFAERDRVTISGRGVFEVFNVNGWGDPIGGFSKALARQLAAVEPRP